ncbi:cupin domain-containing protein [Caballeronia novacaledonica]|uniref:cupin domain-containing protein n=1 Tax=Caballeronia novacaledonica TaxID=1544861 RepID=UPI0038577B13
MPTAWSEGQVEISDKKGNVASFGAGDAFIVEPGFDGVWESLTCARKYFVIAKC